MHHNGIVGGGGAEISERMVGGGRCRVLLACIVSAATTAAGSSTRSTSPSSIEAEARLPTRGLSLGRRSPPPPAAPAEDAAEPRIRAKKQWRRLASSARPSCGGEWLPLVLAGRRCPALGFLSSATSLRERSGGWCLNMSHT